MQPIYEQIISQIKANIMNGELKEETPVSPYTGERTESQCADRQKIV